MERIGEALKVSHQTVGRDLSTVDNSTKRGRPRNRIGEALKVDTRTISRDLQFGNVPKRTERGRPRKITPEQEAEIGRLTDEGLSEG